MEPKKIYKTYPYKNAIAWKTTVRGIMMNEGHPQVDIGSPPEFKGTADVWCPNSCLLVRLIVA